MPKPPATPSSFDEALAAGEKPKKDVSFEDALAAMSAAPTKPSTNAGLLMVGAGEAIPLAARGALELATNPTFAQSASKAVNVATQLGQVASGVANMNPMQVLAAPRVAWAAGKGGYWLARGAQAVAAPVAKVLDAVAPYAQTLATLGGAQTMLNFAQTIEPNRRDIGTFGASIEQPRSDAEKSAHPALLNMLASKVEDGIKALMGYGFSREEAVKAISDQTIQR